MISLSEILQRFRRSWAPPGPALTRVAPPVDATARLRHEIGPLLVAIGETQERAAAITAEADRKANELRDAASRQAEETLRDAEKRVASARADAATQRQEAMNQDILSVLDSARHEVQRIEARSTERLPEMVAQVMDCVLNGPKASS